MKITTRHHCVAEHIACGQTYAGAARLAGVSRATTMRWLKVDAFNELVETKCAESLEPLARARQMMHEAVPDMVKTIIGLATDVETEPRVRLIAATAILDRSGLPKGAKVDVAVDANAGDSLAIQLLRSMREDYSSRASSDDPCVGT